MEDGVGSGEICLIEPAQAEEFVERTGVDALAVAIGTSHGAYKFSREPDGDILAMDLIEDIHRRLPDTHIVMHGSSSVPAELGQRVKAAGGEVDAGFGVPISAIRRGIEHGVRKVNIDTDGRPAITAFVREHLRDSPGDWDPRGIGKAARAGQKLICMQRMQELGMAGHAGDYAPLSLEEMAERYAAGVRSTV
jgi:fructose-bisphosphate aldolase class II